METFNIQQFADSTNYIPIFQNPTTANLRVPVSTNDDGDIAIEGDDIAGNKNFNFTNTKVSATAYELIYGSIYTPGIEPTTSGIVTTFIEYLLGSEFVETGIKRTVVQNVVQGVWTPPTPETDPEIVPVG